MKFIEEEHKKNVQKFEQGLNEIKTTAEAVEPAGSGCKARMVIAGPARWSGVTSARSQSSAKISRRSRDGRYTSGGNFAEGPGCWASPMRTPRSGCQNISKQPPRPDLRPPWKKASNFSCTRQPKRCMRIAICGEAGNGAGPPGNGSDLGGRWGTKKEHEDAQEK